MKLVRNISAAAILGLGATGCLPLADQSMSSTSPEIDRSVVASELDTVKFSDDNVLLIPKDDRTIAARPFLVNAFYRVKWDNGTVIRVSMHGAFPGIARSIIDSVARQWSSLIDPDLASRISFMMVGNNDPTAQLRIIFSPATHPTNLGEANRTLTGLLDWNNNALIIGTASITFFAITGTTTNNWTSRDYLYNVALHEMGHVVGLADEYTAPYINEVMYGEGDPSGPRKFFGTDDVQSINEIFHGSRSTYSKWIPIFSGGDIGWDAAKVAYTANRSNYKLLGIVLPTSDNRPGLTTLYRFQRANGTFALWDEPNASTLTCPDDGLTPGQVGQAFVKVYANNDENSQPVTGLLHESSYLMTHRPTAATGWTNVFVNTVQPNFGCQRQVGWIPSLHSLL